MTFAESIAKANLPELAVYLRTASRCGVMLVLPDFSMLAGALCPGFIDRPDDTPYLVERFAIEWNALEHWDVSFAWAVPAVCWLRGGRDLGTISPVPALL